MNTKKVIPTIKYTLIIYGAICLYCILSNFSLEIGILYPMFAADFSIGFCSRLLVGSVIRIFKDTITKEWLRQFLIIFTYCLYIPVAHYLGSTLSRESKERKNTLLAFCAIFVLCPFSISIYMGDIFGFVDVFNLVVVLMSLYMAENKYLIWLLPVITAAGTFIHNSYITAYMAPCLGIIAYMAVKKYGKKIWAGAVFIVSSVTCFISSVYTVIFANNTIKMSPEEVAVYISQKGNCSVGDATGYLEAFLFNIDTSGLYTQATADNTTEILPYMADFVFNHTSVPGLISGIAILPILALFFFVWIKAMKSSRGFMEKVPYILFMLTPVPQLMSLILSVDASRFYSTIIIIQTFYLFMCIRNKDSAVLECIDLLGSYKPCILSTLAFSLML